MRVAVLALALAGCAPVEPPVSEFGAGTCDATAARALAGRAVDDALVVEAKQLSRSKVARIIPSGTAVTMDYRTDRLNLTVDAKRTLLKVGCG